MRPVNLVPPEQRRGERAPTRTGAVAPAVVGLLALALIAVVSVVLTNNKITEHQDEIATLEAEEAAAKDRAEALRPYAEFASVQEARATTVTSLAESRFDWERILRELAIVTPTDVWLTKMAGTVSPEVAVGETGDSSLRSSIPGPALELIGCGKSHDAVAAFAAALEDVDGVTRVGVNKSAKPETGVGGTNTPVAGGESCATRSFIAQFEITVAFDEVPVATPTIGTPAPTATPTSSDAGGVADAEAQQNEARGSIQKQTDKSRDAVNLIPGTVR